MTETYLNLPPDLQAQLARLVMSIPRPRYSDTVRQMLLDHGLVTEGELAELRGVSVGTLQIQRSRGQLPPHYKWGELICYATDDIANLIKADKTETAAWRKAQAEATAGDLLGRKRRKAVA